ncbi:MAG: LPS export ABC transporter periplasmic protein LptC [Parashewanella sp.]
MNRVTLAIILFFSTALFLYWQVQVKQGQQAQHVSTEEIPDYVATNLNSLEFDKKGKLSSRVTAEHMEHYQNKDITLFAKPVYVLFGDNDATPWRVEAQQGLLTKEQSQVVLTGGVVLKAVDKQEPLQSVHTDSLKMDLTTNILTSDDKVYIKGHGFHSQGTGLFADKEAEIIRLKSQVSGTYEAK